MKFVVLIVLATLVVAGVCFADEAQAPGRVAIQMAGSRYQLLRDCADFTINGVHGLERLDMLRDAGGNCVLAPDLATAEGVLDQAQRAGVTAAVVLSLREGGAVSYTNPASVATAIHDLKPGIQKLKDHPALLLWIIRSDIADTENTNIVAYRSVNALAKLVRGEDPNHPIAADLGVLDAASPGPKMLASLCAEVDILGWTPTAEYDGMPNYIRTCGWYKPYIVMRIMAPLAVAGETTPWLSPVEPPAATRSGAILAAYSNLVAGSGGLCLGSFMYSWDPIAMITPTWFSLTFEDGSLADVVDTLTYCWTGAYPANRAPEIASVTSAVSSRLAVPGSVQMASVTASDPDSDPLSYEWVLVREVSLGDAANLVPAKYETVAGALAQPGQPQVEFTVPTEGGAYRLIVYARDDKGRAASANIPFLVEASRAPIVAKPAVAQAATDPAAGEEAAEGERKPLGPPARVEVRHTMEGGWKLYVDNEPFFVKGAGGRRNLEELKAAGGNAIRTWSTDFANKVLDDAHEQGLKVCLGLWMQQERHRFDYNNREAVQRQLEKLRVAVNKYKNHPALLMWCCGIEVEWGEGTNEAVYRAINEVARMVHEEDPNHPTTTAFADIGANSFKAALAARYCPELDILGINSYGGLASMADRLRGVGWVRPYMIMEFGPKGQWEVEKTPWGAEIEQMPLEKASFYLQSYLKSVSASENWCLGSFVFSWDHKFECTPTWYSMFLLDGSKLNTVDTMWSAWSKKAPENRCPQITKLESPVKHKKVSPGKVMDITVTAVEPDRDEMRYEWILMSETKSKGGDGIVSTTLKPVNGLIKDPAAAATQMTTPKGIGAYRLFCYVYDGRGGASTANMPFYVERQ